MADKTFTIEDLSQLLISLMNKSKSETKQNEVEDKSTKETKNDNENKGEVFNQKQNKIFKEKKKDKNDNAKTQPKEEINLKEEKIVNEIKDNPNNSEKENINSGIIYKFKDKDEKVYYYVYHRKRKDLIDLRCKDPKCNGTDVIDENQIINIKTKCSISYENHNYCKEIIAYNKIKQSLETSENMKEEAYQKMYFKIYLEKFPSI